MAPELLIESSQLPAPAIHGDFASQCHALLIQQKLTWELLRANYASLNEVETRTLEFDGFVIKLQFNPRRITSSAAKVDEKSIKERRCFLCPSNLPKLQRALPFEDGYLVLCNPFPIFPEHFTIPHREHLPQLIAGSFGTMLTLSEAIGSRYTVFYNGPKCGASAPDHVHFQAGTKNLMPLDWEFDAVTRQYGRELVDREGLRGYSVTGPLRNFMTLESDDREQLERGFAVFYQAFKESAPPSDEPMLNILSSYEAGKWRVLLFPRAKHRPDFFFAEGDRKILLSPASVDLGGLCIMPVERDFERLTADHLRQMFQEVCLPKDAFERLSGVVAAGLKAL